MATARERIQAKSYQELSALVLGKPEMLNTWNTAQLKSATDLLTKGASPAAFFEFERTQEELVSAIKTARTVYQKTISKWDKTPTWTNFPNTHKEYRQLIYNLEDQLAIAQQARQNLQPRVRTSTHSASTSKVITPPKEEQHSKGSGFWKGFLASTLLAGVGLFGWFGAKATNSNEKVRQEPPKPTQRIVVVQRRSSSTSIPGSGSAPTSTSMSGSVSAPTSTSLSGGLKGRISQGMNSPVAPVQAYVNSQYVAATAQNEAIAIHAARVATDDERRMNSSDLVAVGKDTLHEGHLLIQELTQGVQEIRNLKDAIRGK